MKILFLYTELAEYFLNCVRSLSTQVDEVLIIHFPVNKEAPFQFTALPANVKMLDRSKLDLQELKNTCVNFDPDKIVVSGWIDKEYLKVSKSFFSKVPTIMTLDNQWKGNTKQKLACWLSPIWLKKIFSHVWVPGNAQQLFAEKLGFETNKILKGFYVANQELYSNYYFDSLEIKKNKVPHRFIYVGRYYDFKGITDLWQAFIELKKENNNDWELWCLGVGDIPAIEHPSIKHFGFVQPIDMQKYIAETSVFVLPSRVEPWGVVVHEFTLAGFPIICSSEVGAASSFLLNGTNGYFCEASNVEQLKNKMNLFIKKEDSKILAMGEKSRELALKVNVNNWIASLLNAN
jgi:glycosyltransferase involved in cell wall biosynthesis